MRESRRCGELTSSPRAQARDKGGVLLWMETEPISQGQGPGSRVQFCHQLLCDHGDITKPLRTSDLLCQKGGVNGDLLFLSFFSFLFFFFW
jgi:hypothetical protein